MYIYIIYMCVYICKYIHTYIHTYIHIHIHTVECYSVLKKERRLAICDNLQGIILGEKSQTEKDQYCMLSLIRGIFFLKSNC